jgi:formylglycine-generating enzyme
MKSQRSESRNILVLWAVYMCVAVLFTATRATGNVFSMPSGQTSLLFVPVNDPNNAPDSNGLGSVPYSFNMGEFLVTSAQYTQLLNAVAESDPYGLYNMEMGPSHSNAGITQSGTSGSYAYSVLTAEQNYPIIFENWGDATRFCNWLSNGQPSTGVEDASTSEDGSYALNGAVTDAALIAVTRSPTADYVIPSENEFCKSAYYRGGSTNAGYWLYPTRSNIPPVMFCRQPVLTTPTSAVPV